MLPKFLLFVSFINAVLSLNTLFPDCPGKGCTGTATQRNGAARSKVQSLFFGQSFNELREQLVTACGLKVQHSTSHCFADFNHVDCCTMVGDTTHQTNEDSKVEGMHHVNYLGAHIEAGSLTAPGSGGSWCTCHLSTPHDVCHKQFGAIPGFKTVWCNGGTTLVAVDDTGKFLNGGNPVAPLPSKLQRDRNWQVIQASSDAALKNAILASCQQAMGEA